MTEQLKAPRVIAAIQHAHGNVAAAAVNLRCSRTTVYNYITKHASVKAALDESRETMIDNVESVLYKQALEGEAWAVCFYLKTQAKHRGYVERTQQEISGRDGEQLQPLVIIRADQTTPDSG